jgi:hypothetical protein
MNAHASVEMGRLPLRLPLRRISVSTMYAWTRVLEAYGVRHPHHEVLVFYHRSCVHDLKLLVRHSPQLDPAGFEVRVQAPDSVLGDVPRLIKLLEESAGPELQHFLTDNNPDSWFGGHPAVERAG